MIARFVCVAVRRLSFLTVVMALLAGSAAASGMGDGWSSLFTPDLSNAIYPQGVWRMEDGVLTATADDVIWSSRPYENFVLDLEFKNAPGSNSGVIIYASEREDWIPNSLEIQIADDHDEQWGNAPGSWRAGAIFGHVAPSGSMVKPPGLWNRLIIEAIKDSIKVTLNGTVVSRMDMKKWTSATTNPDGSHIPSWLSRPVAELQRSGYVGLQGFHGEAPVWFRKIRIKELAAPFE